MEAFDGEAPLSLSASEVARRLVDELERASIPHAVGGALALGVWGFPRATKDVDLDVFVPADALAPVFAAIRQAGCQVDEMTSMSAARERGDFQAWYGSMRIDVFVSSIPFYEQMRARVRSAPLEGRPAWFLSPEDLAVMKLLFFRAKDLIDVERLVSASPTFDREYVTAALVDLVGGDDSRLPRWRALLADVDAAQT